MSYTKDKSVWLMLYLRDYRSWTTTHYSYAESSKLTRTRTGESNPNWRDQVKAQQNATTPMTGVYEYYSGNRGRAKVTFKNYLPPGLGGPIAYETIEGDGLLPFNKIDWVTSIGTGDAYNRALISYLKNARKAQQGFAGLTFLGELRESLKMIRHPAQGLKNLCSEWLNTTGRARRKFGRSRKGTDKWKRELSSLWLEQAFGWQPLVNDINAAWRTYRNLRDRRDQVPVTGFGIDTEFVPHRSETFYPHDFFTGQYRYNRRSTERAFVRFRGMVKLKTIGSNVDALEPFGFTFDSWIPTAWELLPWSFLIDYFSNIGDVLEAGTFSTANLAWTSQVSIVSQISEMQGQIYELASRNALGENFISCEGDVMHSRRERRVVTRSPQAQLSIPTLKLEIPGHPAQWANMTALFAAANAQHPQRLPRVRTHW